MIAAAILLIHGRSANALLLWNWSYSGAGVSASGTFTTNDAPDAAGFYQIVGITGVENGVGITGLQPTGTTIPGNEPYAVDNLVSAFEPHLTAYGFGFSLANGNYANPFFKDSSYYQYLSIPPYVNGAGPEKPVSFSAAIVPEPSAASLMLAGLVGLIGFAQVFAPRRTSIEASSTGWQRQRSVVLQAADDKATERAWSPCEARMTEFVICDCAVGSHLAREGRY